jgi:hypothetical protein
VHTAWHWMIERGSDAWESYDWSTDSDRRWPAGLRWDDGRGGGGRRRVWLMSTMRCGPEPRADQRLAETQSTTGRRDGFSLRPLRSLRLCVARFPKGYGGSLLSERVYSSCGSPTMTRLMRASSQRA